MNIIIDIGNTRAKVYIAENNVVTLRITCDSHLLLKELSQMNIPKTAAVIVSSVKKVEGELSEFCRTYSFFLLLTGTTPLPIINKYNTPSTLGVDRLAAVAGASIIFPGINTLVIDTGTCITYDIITSNKEYIGGSISPGILMRFKALHTFTDQLPLISFSKEFLLTGSTTEEAIRSGVINGCIAEIEGICEQYSIQYPGIKTVITGGDATFFEKALKNHIFADPLLVAKGLNEILEYNRSI